MALLVALDLIVREYEAFRDIVIYPWLLSRGASEQNERYDGPIFLVATNYLISLDERASNAFIYRPITAANSPSLTL